MMLLCLQILYSTSVEDSN